jgi:hypothetical protein
MDKKELILKYLDGELSGQEKKHIEKLLETDPETKHLLEEIKTKKQSVFEHLNGLNPDTDITIPKWNGAKTDQRSKTKSIYRILKWAAILIIPVALYFLIHETSKLRNLETNQPIATESKKPHKDNQSEIILTKQTDLDWAISPNRSWTKKQLVQTEIITKSM